jgi:plasmid stability protein
LTGLEAPDISDINPGKQQMADLLIRDIQPHLKREIEQRARANRRSLSEEAKTLLEKALSATKDERKLGTLMSNLLAPEHRGDDLVFEVDHPMRPPPDFE